MTARALTLSHNPGEWDGTFTVVLDALVRDLLSDGAPFDATVTYDADGHNEATITGKVTGITDDGALIVATVPMPSAVPMVDVIAIVVP